MEKLITNLYIHFENMKKKKVIVRSDGITDRFILSRKFHSINLREKPYTNGMNIINFISAIFKLKI